MARVFWGHGGGTFWDALLSSDALEDSQRITVSFGARQDQFRIGTRGTSFLAFCRYPAFALSASGAHGHRAGRLQPSLSTQKDQRGGRWAAATTVELAYVPTNAYFSDRIECHIRVLRYVALDGTDHRSHEKRKSMIRRYIV